VSEPFEPYPRHWIEYVATFVGLIVAVISLWVAIATERANQKMVDANYRMVAAASWPFLQLNSGNNDDQGKRRLTLTLENAGVGPAKIETLEVFWRGKAYSGSWALLKACCATPGLKTWNMGTLPASEKVLRAGEERPLLRLDPTPETEAMWKTFDRVRQTELTYRACYCSVFDECWIGDLAKLRPKPVAACPKPETPYIQ
jgi:hypothetical protein